MSPRRIRAVARRIVALIRRRPKVHVPIDQLPDLLLRPLAAVLPHTYANGALRAVMIDGATLGDALVHRDLGLLAAFAVLAAAALSDFDPPRGGRTATRSYPPHSGEAGTRERPKLRAGWK